MNTKIKNVILSIVLALCINACFLFVMLNAKMGVVAIILGALFGIASAALSYIVLANK